MVNVLVTGATGGIGRSLVPLLAARGADIVASGRNVALGRALAGAGVRFVAADLSRDDLAPLLDGTEVVVHLAARAAPWGPAAQFDADNVLATRRLLDAAAAAGALRFVFASTPSIFAERAHRLDLRAESAPAAAPVNAYARTKLAAERLVRDERRMATMILRPSAVLGPDDGAILPRLLRVVRRGVLPLGNGARALFHPTDVRDAAAAFAVAALGDATGTVNVAGPRPLAVAAMAQSLAARLGVRLRLLPVPEVVLHAIARAGERWARREPALTVQSAMTLSWSRTFDVEETAMRLGWRPRRDADATLAHALAR